jgi:hypothetical protein
MQCWINGPATDGIDAIEKRLDETHAMLEAK